MRASLRWRPVLLTALLAAAVMALGGCVGIRNGFSAQLDVVGNVEIEQELCASGSAGCPAGVGGPSGDLPAQVLLGFRIPTGSTPPATFTSTGPEALAFAQSPGYAAELERLAPTDASRKWVGYITGVVNYTTAGVQRATVKPQFALDRGANGSPFPGPFPHRPVVGLRLISATWPAERPVTCGAALNADSGDGSICVDDPALAAVATDFQRDTRDLGVLAAGPVSAPRGSLATVPFTLRYAGTAGTAANFSLAATTTLPGAAAVPNPPTLAPPADSDTVIPVAVGVPASAAPGGYDVTFTARLANGQVRTGTRRLNVTAAPAGGVAGGAARARLSVVLPRGLALAAARRRGIVVLIGSTRRVSARVSLFQGRARRAKAVRTTRLRVPGPTRVVLRSKKLVPGAYRIVIRVQGRNIVRRGTLRR